MAELTEMLTGPIQVTAEKPDRILASIRKGDQEAFRELTVLYVDYAFSIAFRILGDEEDARDAVQETFIAVWTNLKHYDPRKSFRNWLYRILVNRCLDMLRKRKRQRLIRPDPEQWKKMKVFSSDNLESQLENAELAGIIRLLTERLSPKQKIVFILSELEGIPNGEIAEITGMNPDTVKSNLNLARKKIRELIEKKL
ncbi:MAG: RNA polymerase sigma factor [Bacteroidota bacterium]